MRTKLISLLTVIVLVFSLMAFTCVGASAASVAGDADGDGVKTSDDAVYLLYNVLFGNEEYPIDSDCDYNGDGVVTAADAVYLMNNVLFGDEDYPLGDDDGNIDMGDQDEGFGEWIPIG